MPLISQTSLVRAASKAGNSCPRQTSVNEFISDLTHLHLEGRGIRHITNLESCFSVRVLYLYNNQIESIHGLETLRQLTHLYLQNNRIQKLTGLETLVKLQKLYVEDNEISCVEGLEHCTSLQELHLSRQRLPGGIALEFDPGCLEALAESLTRLALQHCNIADVSPLAALQQLHNLNMAGNAVLEVAPIQGLLGSLPHLHTLELRGNPLCKARSYRKDIVGPARNLQHLDGTRVLKQERLFLQQLHARKLSRDISSRRTSQAHLLRARQMLDLPNMPNVKQLNAQAKPNNSKQSQIPPYGRQPTLPAQPNAQIGEAHSWQRAASSNSDCSSPDIPAFGPETLLDTPADQHALDSLEGLHNQTRSLSRTTTGLSPARTGPSRNVSSLSDNATGLPFARSASARSAPSRGGSSLSSSRAGSAVPRLRDDALDAATNALTLQGMSLV